ncbi:MAG: filamentous hemagglutinin N-terminal domain-containing protein [Steroidobacter sp.]
MNTNNKSAQPSRSRYLAAAVSAVLSLAAASATHAGPQNGVVVSGEAVISAPDLHLTQIDQGSQSASIDWQSFDIAAQERVIFNQPAASSIALNRILGQDPSQIHGGITANGRVFLINPNGVIFGASSRINVGSLVASSLDITDVDAASGRYVFGTAADHSGAISNSGQIIAADGGSVTLLGGSVINNGLIVADYGSVNLGAGRAATLHFDGDGLVRFQIDAGLLENSSGAGAAVDNMGEIRADGGQVLLTARAATDVIARAVNNDGVIRAARVENVGGRIRLLGPEGAVVNGGTLDAAGASATSAGGEVQVLGDRVELTGAALVDVSGGAGGGTALLGGSFGGADPGVLNSQRTDVSAGAVIRADSTVSGNAGQVAVWSDGTTTFHGDIYARAFGADGDGGYAEVSGREHLRVGGHAWLNSVNGRAGTLLLDPGSLTITDGPNAAPTGDLDVVNDGWIVDQLEDANVIIETDASDNDLTEDLIVDGSANISWANANSLTLRGDDSLSLAAGSNIANTGSGALVLESSGDVSVGGTVSLAGNLTVDAGADITQSAAVVVGGAMNFTAGGGITQSGALDIGGPSSFLAAGGQSIVLANAGNAFDGTVRFASVSGGNLQDVVVSSTTALDLDALTIDGNLNAAAGGSITQSGALIVDGASSFTAAGGQSVLLDDAGNRFGGAVSLASGGILQNVALRDSTALDLQALTLTGTLGVTAGGAITQSGALVVGGATNLSAAAGQSILLNNAGNSFAGALTLAANGGGNLQNVTVRDASAVDLQTLAIDGNLSIAAGGAISQSGSLSVNGAASFRTLNDVGAAIALSGTNTFGSVQAAVRNTADTANAAASIVINESNNTLLGDIQTGSGQSVSIVSAGAIAALANTDISTGSLALAAAGDIGSAATPISLIAPTGRLDAVSSGNVYVANTGGVGSTVALDRVVAGAAGAIEIVSDGDIQVADVRAGGSVSLTSTNGGIFDDNLDGAGSQLVTGSLTLQATGAIGQAIGVGNGALDLQAGSIGASAQAGGIYLDETDGDLAIRQVSAAGPVWIQAAGGSILDDLTDASVASITSTTGGVQLSALNSIGTVTDLRTRQGAPIVVDTSGGALSASVTSATGRINLDIASGSNPTAGAATISAGGSGQLLLQSAGDLSLNSFNSAISGFSAAGFSSGGILQLSEQQSALIAGPLATLVLHGADDIVQADRVFDLSATHLIFESGAQGGDVTLNTNVDQLDAAIGNGANLTVVEGAGDITLGAIVAGGDVSIRAANIFDDGDLGGITRVTAGNAVSLLASAGIGQEPDAGRIDTAGNAVSVLAEAGPVFISHLGDLQLSGEARGGRIDVAAPTGSITVSGVLRATGPLTLTAGADAAGATPAVAGDINLLGAAQTDDAIMLSALGGGVIADAGDAMTHLSATEADLTATLIGSESNRLNVAVESLNARATDGLYLSEADAIQLRTVSAQNVVIDAAGAIADDGDAQTRITAGDVSLSASAIGAVAAGAEIDTSIDRLSAIASAGGVYIGEQGDLQLAAVNASGAGNEVALVASGAMTDDGDNATRVSGGSVTLAAAAIGAVDANAEIDMQATSLTATASSGGVFIGEADALQLNAITAGAGGNIGIAAGGALIDDGNDATRVAGENVSLAGRSIGAADNRVDTAAAVLSTNAADGGIYIDEQDDITLAEVESAGTGNTVDLRTGANGSVIVQNLTTQGGAVNLMAGGAGSLTVTGAIASNNGVVNLTAGNALAAPSLITGTGSVVLRTVNDLNVGAITAGSVSITSDTGDVVLGTVNAGAGPASITAANGTITDGSGTSLTGGQVTLSAQSIGSGDNPLNIAADTLNATTSTGGLFVDEADGLSVSDITSAGALNLVAGGSLIQTGAIASAASAISLFAESIDMESAATTVSAGGNITYAANGGDVTLAVLNAGSGRTLVIAADSVYSSLGSTSATNNITASAVEVRAGGLASGAGEIGTASSPLGISTPGALRSVYLIVPTLNGIQISTPRVNYSGPSSALLLKGYSGSSGALLFDLSSTFTPDAVLSNGESIVPLLNGRIAINSDSLRAATQALSSGVTTRVNVDWGAFDPNVSLFGILDPALRLPADQIDDAGAAASLIPEGTTLVVTRDGWRLQSAALLY